MTEPNSLASLINEQLDFMGYTITDAANITGLSWQQIHRLCNGKSRYIQPRTIRLLQRLGLDERAIVLAAYGSSQALAPSPAG